eukprot:s21_g3.t1
MQDLYHYPQDSGLERNMALDDAQSKGLVCVQVSDDISKWEYYDCEKQNYRGQTTFTKANQAVKGVRTYTISPLAAAQFLLAKMRSSPDKPKLGGVFPTRNHALALGAEEYSKYNFILGDFFVADKSKVRFDESMTLKEDYDYTCGHCHAHGSVLRCNRLFIAARHATNKGGAVAVRDSQGVKETEALDLEGSGARKHRCAHEEVAWGVPHEWPKEQRGHSQLEPREEESRAGDQRSEEGQKDHHQKGQGQQKLRLQMAWACEPEATRPGAIVVPPPVTDHLPVPGRFEFATKDLFLFVADGGLAERPFRKEVIEELEKWQRALPHLFYVASRDKGKEDIGRHNMALQEWSYQIRRALFCPVLPGDNTFRIRLFHAILAGCIPVVLLFPGGGWYRAHGPPADGSVPFPGRIDWHGFVVELPFDPEEKEGFKSWAKALVPHLMRMSPEDVRARQQALAAAALLLRYDFQGTRPDAFTAILDALAARPRRAPDVMDCFDPRQRFATNRSFSGLPDRQTEEAEIYGLIACCPRWQKVDEGGNDSAAGTEECDLNAQGVCFQFPDLAKAETGGEGPNEDRLANLRKHLEAMFLHQSRFDEVADEDQQLL